MYTTFSQRIRSIIIKARCFVFCDCSCWISVPVEWLHLLVKVQSLLADYLMLTGRKSQSYLLFALNRRCLCLWVNPSKLLLVSDSDVSVLTSTCRKKAFLDLLHDNLFAFNSRDTPEFEPMCFIELSKIYFKSCLLHSTLFCNLL